jgi:hypothetical protein
MKRLLFIGLRYHSYTEDIRKELALLGYDVTYHEIQPRTLWFKTLRVLSPTLYQRALDRHHRRIIEAERGHRFDVVLFIQAHQFSVVNIETLKRDHPESRFVLYNWDSLSNHDYRPQMHVFDQVFTFDPEDARQLGAHHLPLFCVRSFQNLTRRRQEDNAIYFVGNIVSVQRYRAVQAFKAFCRREGIRLNLFLACSPLVFVRLLRQRLLPLDVSFFSIRHARFIEMIESSTTVFDFANHQQTGYTMRVIENLCAGKKLITSNRRIQQEPFYSPDRILVFDGVDFSGVKAFMARPPCGDDPTFERFHIQAFVKRLVA